jgi:hypothetical protein
MLRDQFIGDAIGKAPHLPKEGKYGPREYMGHQRF